MREEIRYKMVAGKSEYRMFICETCQKESPIPYVIRACELKHLQDLCQHNFVFELGPHWDDSDLRINKECTICKLVIAKVIKDNDNKMLSRIWDIIPDEYLI